MDFLIGPGVNLRSDLVEAAISRNEQPTGMGIPRWLFFFFIETL